MYVIVVFVIRCLYSAVSLTLVREQRFIRIIYFYYHCDLFFFVCVCGGGGAFRLAVFDVCCVLLHVFLDYKKYKHRV